MWEKAAAQREPVDSYRAPQATPAMRAARTSGALDVVRHSSMRDVPFC